MSDTTTDKKIPSDILLRDDLSEMTTLVDVMAETVDAMRDVMRRALAHHRAVLAARDAEGR